jgi:hypothetical protein
MFQLFRDSELNTPPERNRNSSMKSNCVPVVSGVSLLAGDRGHVAVPDALADIPASCRRCRHCNGTGGVNEVAIDGRTIFLHRECETAWLEENDAIAVAASIKGQAWQ